MTRPPALSAQAWSACPGMPSRSPRASTSLFLKSSMIRRSFLPSSACIPFEEEACAVRHLCHPSKEEAALADQLHPVKLAGREPRDGVREIGNRRRNVSLGWGEPGEPVAANKQRDALAVDLSGPRGQRGDELVIPLGDVAGAGRLGNVRVVQFDGKAVDIAQAEPTGSQRSLCQYGGDLVRRGPIADPVHGGRVQ